MRVFKQPNGLYGLWSNIVGGPVYWNMTKQDYIDVMLEDAKKDIEERADEIFEHNYNVSTFSSLKDNFVVNMSKEEFSEFLKSCGSLLSVDNFTFYCDLAEKEKEDSISIQMK